MDKLGVERIFQWPNNWHQYYATFAANLIALSQGWFNGWINEALPIFASNSTPLTSGPLTIDEMSWIGSIYWIGAVFGSLLFGQFINSIGSRRVVLSLSLPTISFWVLIYFGNTYHHILIARFVAGFSGGGVYTTVVLFISEIANDDIRGRLGSFTTLLRNVGTLIAFVLGANISYEYIPWISIIVPILFVIIFMTIPNTPQYYLYNNQTHKAECSLKYYKDIKGNNDQHENNVIREELEKLRTITNKLRAEHGFQLADICNRKAMKGLAIGIAFTIFAQFTACWTILNYAVMTFTKFGNNIDPHISSISLAIALIVGSLANHILADKLGRKKLNLISLMGSAFGLFATAFFYYLNINGYNLTAFTWMPVACLIFVIFISSAGIVSLQFVCSIENLPILIQTHGMTIICVSLNFICFVSAKIYPILLDSVDLHGCLLIYGVGSIVGFFFVLFVLSETSGRPLDDVIVDEKPNIGCERRLSSLRLHFDKKWEIIVE